MLFFQTRSHGTLSPTVTGHRHHSSAGIGRVIAYCCLLVTGVLSCTKDIAIDAGKKTDEYFSAFLTGYYDLFCTTVQKTPGYFPPQAARAYGYLSIAQYEAVVHGIDAGYSLHPQLQNFQNTALPQPIQGLEYNWAIASNAATAHIFRLLFEKRMMAEDRENIDKYESGVHESLAEGVGTDVSERSRLYGISIANAVFDYSKTDGGHEAYLDPFQLPFTAPTDPYCWVPTGAIKTPLCPKWGQNRAFLSVNITRTKVAAPVPYSEASTSEFYQQALAVYQQVTKNTSEQKEIARYWSDDPFQTCTPAGHSFNILSQLLQQEKSDLARAAVAYAMMGIAENDAFIACWKGKYEFFLLRPVTYIQRFIDPSFTTVLSTPPFPAYTSGHSTEIGAASRIYTHVFTNGSGDYSFTDYSQLRYNLFARSFQNFNHMAEECAVSRLYGGIHYPMDNEKGLQLGRAIGDNVRTDIRWPSL